MPDPIDAPPFPVPTSQIIDVETVACHRVVEAFRNGTFDPLVVGLQRRMADSGLIAMADAAYQSVYGHVAPRIPRRSERGEGWDLYVAAWMRIRDCIRTELEIDTLREELGVPKHPMANEGSGPTTAAPLGFDGYPLDWCPGCGAAALDSHITCGAAACNEAEMRSHGTITPDWNEAD